MALAVGGIDLSAMPPVAGLVLAMASPVIYAVRMILSARLSGERTEHAGADSDAGAAATVATPLMMTATATVLWLAALAIGCRPALQIPTEAWPGLIGVGAIAMFVAIETFYAGTQRIGAAQASLVSTVERSGRSPWPAAAGRASGARSSSSAARSILTGVVIAQTRGRSEPARDEAPLPQPTVRLADD